MTTVCRHHYGCIALGLITSLDVSRVGLSRQAIWGTNYLITNFVQSFRHFIRTFRLPRRR